jgi:hypothetical protein
MRPAFATPGRLLALPSADKAPVSAYSAVTDAAPRLSQVICSEHAIRAESAAAAAAAVESFEAAAVAGAAAGLGA